MYVADLGLDRSRALISPADPAFAYTPAAAGPPRLQLSRDDRFLYVNHETDSEVSQVRGASLSDMQKISTLPAGADVKNATAEIIIMGSIAEVGFTGHALAPTEFLKIPK